MKILLSLLLTLSTGISLLAQTTLIDFVENPLLTNTLKEGKSTYLVYIEKPDGTVMDISLWEREISFSKINTTPVVEIHQHWKNQDPTRVKQLYSMVKQENFAPLYHYTKNGKGVIEAYQYTDKAIIGADSVSGNEKADFHVALDQNVFNFALDIEMLRILPFQKNTRFSIPCYHPGAKTPPKNYVYVVENKEMLHTATGKLSCWKLQIEYGKNNLATFWISEDSRKFIRMEESYGPIKRVKVLL